MSEAGVAVVIPSLGRPNLVAPALALFPPGVATVAVNEDEADLYARQNPGVPFMVYPRAELGIARTRNWVLREIPESRPVFFMDDDIERVWCVVGQRPRRLREPWAIYNAVASAAMVAIELGCAHFGFNSHPDPRVFENSNPIALRGHITGASQGIVGRRYWYDPAFVTKSTADFTMTCLAGDHFLFKDKRFVFENSTQSLNTGGLSRVRTSAVLDADIKRFEEKWGVKKRWLLKEVLERQRRVEAAE